MTSQQVQFAETIRAMKLALKRKPDDSDSDTSIHLHTNRGNKLKRRAKYVREGRLDDTGGLAAYRKPKTHAGYTRQIISTNPPLYDADGDLYSPGEESDNERVGASPIEDNAFGQVQLEHLLRPLTNAAGLAEHPSLSVAYKSKALTQMAEEALEMVRREKAVLWKAKRLLQRFRGDADWVPCEVFEGEGDDEMLLPDHHGGTDLGEEPENASVPSLNLELESLTDNNGTFAADGDVENRNAAIDQTDAADRDEMEGVDAMDMALQQAAVEAEKTAEEANEAADAVEEELQASVNGDGTAEETQHAVAQGAQAEAREPPDSAPSALEIPALNDIRRSIEPNDPAEVPSEHTSNSGKETNTPTIPSHAMTTRARARSPQKTPSPSPTPSDSASIPAIHPWFHIPETSIPDRDLGLPAQEAEETRRLLLLYVQKQEQVVRQLQTLYDGLQRADRIRWEVYRASKAQGHLKDDGKGNMVTEMSDGEDWYDVEDWGLGKGELKVQKNGILGLEKGKDEVEDADAEGEGRRGGRRRRGVRM